MITIIDYGIGNLGSVFNMFKKIGASAKISDEPEEILKAEKLLLPGVGSFDTAMTRINGSGLYELLNEMVLQKQIAYTRHYHYLKIYQEMKQLRKQSKQLKQKAFSSFFRLTLS